VTAWRPPSRLTANNDCLDLGTFLDDSVSLDYHDRAPFFRSPAQSNGVKLPYGSQSAHVGDDAKADVAGRIVGHVRAAGGHPIAAAI
jgi:hypothetical protein